MPANPLQCLPPRSLKPNERVSQFMMRDRKPAAVMSNLERSEFIGSSIDTPESATLASLLASRFSCRAYLPQPVPRATIERILAIAQLTASWCNSQAWQVIVTEGEGTERFRQALHEFASSPEGAAATPDFPSPARYTGVYLERRRDTGWALYNSVGIARGDREASSRQALENFRLFGAPHALIVTAPADLGVYGAVDCGGYVTNFMLAAQSLGVASIAQAAIAMKSPFVRRHFGIADDRRILCGISFGYADPNHPANAFRTPRAHPQDAVEWRTR
jgi:nitroreductase